MKTLIVCFYWKKKCTDGKWAVIACWMFDGWHTIFRIFSQTDPWRDCLRDSFGHSLFFYLRISKWQSLTNLELNLNNCRLVLFLSHVIVCRAKAKPLLGFSFCDNFPCQSTWGNRSWRLQHTAGQRKKTTCLPWTSSCFSLKLNCLDQIWTQRSLWC